MTKISNDNLINSKTLQLSSNLNIPLVVDLDGTLSLVDTLHESAILFFKKKSVL